MNIKEKTCKTALSVSKLPGLDYALNPYEGCKHQCAYCYVPSVCHIKKETWNNVVFVKRNIPLILSKELNHKKKGIVGISTVTDPYQPVEKKFSLTRYCLEQLLKKDFPINIQTKSSLVIRDKDLIEKFSQAEIMMSIASFNETHRKILEPYSSPIADRLQVFNTFEDTHITKSVFLGPLYPMENHTIKSMLNLFVDLKVTKIMIDRFRKKPYFDENIQMYAKNHPTFLSYFNEYMSDQKRKYELKRQYIKTYLQKANIAVVDAF